MNDSILIMIRESGLTNMFDVPVVARVAREFEFGVPADWVTGNQQVYFDSMIAGKFVF